MARNTKAATTKAATTAANGTTKAGAAALPGRVQGLPTALAPGHFVVVHQLANPKQPGSGAHARYAALLALVAKHGNGKFTVAQWAGAVGRASDLRYNTGTNNYGKAFATVHPTAAAAAAALAPKGKAPRKPKAPKATPAAAPTSTSTPAPAPTSATA